MPDSTVAPAIPIRRRVLDAWRGVAIVTMVVDHLCVFGLAMGWLPVDTWPELLRLTVGRVSMPAFMIVSGVLLATHTPSRRRLVQVASVAVALNVLLAAVPTGIHTPEILLLWLGGVLAARWWRPYPVYALVLGLLQAWYWPLAWDGYQPGVVLAFLATGVLVARADAVPPCPLGPLARPVELAGRHPLTCYVAHLVVIVVAAAVCYRTGLVPRP